jgi:elongator complex protein 3
MPGLFATPEKDIAMFTELFSNPDFRPDMLKIYPCMVLEGTGLHKLWKSGKYQPYGTEQAADVVGQMLLRVPRYVRVMRVQRDIPSNLIAAGVKNSNLMQIVEERLAKNGLRCGCIRCREAGIMQRKGVQVSRHDVRMLRYDYAASGGKEVFLSFEDVENNILLGFLRLRIPSRSWRREIGGRAAIVRELHVYGGEVAVGGREEGAIQHAGYGEKLLAEAEHIARTLGKSELLVTAGVGAREYYYRHGYTPKGPYVAKRI